MSEYTTIDNQIPTLDLRLAEQNHNPSEESSIPQRIGWRSGRVALYASTAVAMLAPNAEAQTPSSAEAMSGPPDVYGLVEPYWLDAPHQTPEGMQFFAPATQADLRANISSAAEFSKINPVEKIKIDPNRRGSKLKVSIVQSIARGQVVFGEYVDSDNSQNTLHRALSVRGEVFTKQSTTLTPMLLRKGQKPEIGTTEDMQGRKWGEAVTIEGRDEFALSSIARVIEDGFDPKDPLTRKMVRIRPKKPLTKELIRSGRFYIDVTHEVCEARDPSYDPNGTVCDEESGSSYKVNKRQKPSTYHRGHHYPPKKVLNHFREVSENE